MSMSIRFLLLNNLSDYREALFKRLEEAGLTPQGFPVKDKADFLKKLAAHKPMAIFIGLGALQDKADSQIQYEQVQSWLAEQDQTVPTWGVVDPLDEAVAIKAMSQGLSDYFFTDRLARLGLMAVRLVELDQGSIELVDLNLIVEAYLAEQKGKPEVQGATLTFLPGADLPGVSGQKQALSEAMFLILGEAIKTAPARTKTDVRTYLDAIKGEVCLEVKLTGEGFQAENQQASAVLSEGSLDLIPAQKIVQTHHGRIDIDQGDQADIRICVSLPAILEKQIRGKPRLLVVENSVLMRSILKEALEQEGFIVKVAENGAAALDIMGNFQPEIIISDVVMPVMDGFAFFEAVREKTQWQDIPFIFVTGQSDQKVELNLRALRGATYLLKPIIIDELLVAVRSRLPA